MTCERCGKEFKFKGGGPDEVLLRNEYGDYVHWWLCSDCFKELAQWIDEKGAGDNHETPSKCP
jgi:DNA-directed RNA polymerase subunit RPC12/RpoP